MPEPDYQGYANNVNTLLAPSTIAAGATSLNNLAAQNAQVAAGAQIAAGNYLGGAATLNKAGDLAGARTVNGYGSNVAGASALANRNYPAAAQAFGQGGDVAKVQNAQSGQFQQGQIIGAYLQQAAPVLKQAYAQNGTPGLVHSAGLVTQELTQSGLMTPDQANQWVQQAGSDPQGTLSMVDNFVQKQTYQSVGPNSGVMLNAFGQPTSMIQGPTQTVLNTPSGAQNLTAVPGSITPVGGAPQAQPAAAGGQPSPAPAAAPAPASGAAPAAPSDGVLAPPTVGQSPVNNPGNLRPVGSSTGFMNFATPQAGLIALSDDLAGKAKDGITTLSALANKYAPPGENNTGAWLQTVSGAVGVSDSNAKIDLSNPNTRAAVMAGIVKAEGNPGTQLSGAPLAGPASAPAPGGASVLASTDNGPAFRDATPAENAAHGGGLWQIDAKGQYHQIAGIGDIDNMSPADIAYNAKLIKLTGVPGPALGGSGSGSTRSYGAGMQDALNKAQALARQQDIQDGVTPSERLNRQTTYKAANTFYQQNYKTLNEMQQYETATNGDFQNVEDALEKLGGQTQIKGVNDLLNVARSQFNNVDYNKLQISLKDAQSNYNKIVLGSGTGSGASPGSQSEREDNEELFPDNATPGVMMGNIAQARLGMNNRIGGIQKQLQMAQDTMLAGVPIPNGAISMLRAHPELAPQFNQQYGAGTASDVLGQ